MHSMHGVGVGYDGRQFSLIRLIRMHGVAMCQSAHQDQGYPKILPGSSFILVAALACHNESVEVKPLPGPDPQTRR